MKRIDEHTFETRLNRSITVSERSSDSVLLTLRDVDEGNYLRARLNREEREALIALLQGETLVEPEPEFKVGDIVRLKGNTSRAYTAQTGALARVTKEAEHVDYHWLSESADYLTVEWIDLRHRGQKYRRGFNQGHGRYAVRDFEPAGKLTEADYASIGENSLLRLTEDA